MSGVLRPYTLTDVLGTMNDQLTSPSGSTVASLGQIVEAGEIITISETTPTVIVGAVARWDQGVWGATQWG